MDGGRLSVRPRDPASFSRCVGWSKNSADQSARAVRASGTTATGTRSSIGSSARPRRRPWRPRRPRRVAIAMNPGSRRKRGVLRATRVVRDLAHATRRPRPGPRSRGFQEAPLISGAAPSRSADRVERLQGGVRRDTKLARHRHRARDETPRRPTASFLEPHTARTSDRPFASRATGMRRIERRAPDRRASMMHRQSSP